MRTKADQLQTLKMVPLFQGLSKSDLKYIHSEMNQESFKAGSTIIQEGDQGGRFFVIVEGTAKILIGGRARRTLMPGDHFGELSLLDGGRRTASVVAENDVRALSLTSWNFLATLQENWPIAHKVMVELARMVRDLDKKLN